jgi:ABC-type sugar transport system ATPase subunit
MIYMRNITITTAKSATYLENVGLITSSELSEHLGLCDRILVVREGGIVAELNGAEAKEEQVARFALMGTDELRKSA